MNTRHPFASSHVPLPSTPANLEPLPFGRWNSQRSAGASTWQQHGASTWQQHSSSLRHQNFIGEADNEYVEEEGNMITFCPPGSFSRGFQVENFPQGFQDENPERKFQPRNKKVAPVNGPRSSRGKENVPPLLPLPPTLNASEPSPTEGTISLEPDTLAPQNEGVAS